MGTMVPYGDLASIAVVSLSLNPASVAANTTAEQDFTIPGDVRSTDLLLRFTKPTATAGLGIVNFRVKSANTVSVTFSNNTGSPIDAAAETYTLVFGRPASPGSLPSVVAFA